MVSAPSLLGQEDKNYRSHDDTPKSKQLSVLMQMVKLKERVYWYEKLEEQEMKAKGRNLMVVSKTE